MTVEKKTYLLLKRQLQENTDRRNKLEERQFGSFAKEERKRIIGLDLKGTKAGIRIIIVEKAVVQLCLEDPDYRYRLVVICDCNNYLGPLDLMTYFII